ncbi:LacI family DNA-binding transcriptional regulator [Actinophytocola gossypii]|uniref:LacI family DNA-binding transcriptional regulator n=1 Tax=Actinophytocola gossypii TaxID=2812003 RepID=A0ABT2J191_9PSEU|nr:LacI family DNA-binding transcriptional regulator [Actinophytocola gossypii]MCT2581616.1 LacI family DNA-binding transcriptional regulator [Actinophytocola gossypii]
MAKIEDVARHAGVAPSTVSYVLSGKRSITERTRQRVLRSIEVLGYQPHAGARALASNRSNVVALVVPLRTGIHVPVIMRFATSVVIAAREHDHDVLLLTQNEGVGGLRRVAGTSLVDAIIVMDVELRDERVPVLRELRLPSVLIGFPADADGLTCIDLDFTAAGAACVDHLAELGHRRVALIGSPPEVYARGTGFATRTTAGFTDAAARHGVAASVHPCEATSAAAHRVVSELLREHPDLTGVVVHNEPLIGPVLAAFREAGRSVPDDLSVVAICPDELAEHAMPALTSVSIPAEEVGRQAVGLLMAKLAGDPVPDATLIDARLTVRDSTRSR